jgi:single-strand DNA-binding protein
MNLNKVFLIGRLTQDPQLRSTTTGQQVATLSLATNRNWVDKNGVRQEAAEYHTVVVWGKQAVVANQFLKKGSLVFVEGRLQTRAFVDSQGQNRKTTEIIAERIQLGPRPLGVSRDEALSQKISDKALAEEIPTIEIEGEVKDENESSGADLPF